MHDGGATRPSSLPRDPGARTPSWIGVGIAAGLFLLGAVGLAATVLAALRASEADAIVVAYLGVPLALAGAVALVTSLAVRKKDLPVSIGLPVGCGCATAVVAVVALVVLFTVVWPTL